MKEILNEIKSSTNITTWARKTSDERLKKVGEMLYHYLDEVKNRLNTMSLDELQVVNNANTLIIEITKELEYRNGFDSE